MTNKKCLKKIKITKFINPLKTKTVKKCGLQSYLNNLKVLRVLLTVYRYVDPKQTLYKRSQIKDNTDCSDIKSRFQ